MTTNTTDSSTSRAPERRRVGDTVVATVSHFVLGFWSLLVIVPLLWTLMSSFKTTDAFLQILQQQPQNLAKILALYSARNRVAFDRRAFFDAGAAGCRREDLVRQVVAI